MPHQVVAGLVDLDAENEGIMRYVAVSDGDTIDAPTPFFEGDVLLLHGHDEGCILAPELEILNEDALQHFHKLKVGCNAVANLFI